MIKRYRREEMHRLFSEESKFSAYLKVEIAALKAWSKLGVIPESDMKKILHKASFSLQRIHEIEATTHHDVIAFTKSVSETLGVEGKWIHYGLTSTDVVDTALSYIYKKANDLLQEELVRFQEVLKQNAMKFRETPCIGRTHGIHAEITSFGLKWVLWYDEWSRNLKRFKQAREMLEVGKISGAVGNHANVPTFVQDFVCQELGLGSAKISTQTLQRDRHAHYMATLAQIGSTIEKIAIELRHLQRTEVREVEEKFNLGQKGSSAMPHKRNPIASENITGVARMLRGYMVSSFENIALWHERDISHSSVERVVIPDAIMLLDYALNRYTKVLENLVVYPKRMMENIYATKGLVFSQRILNALVEKGVSRNKAYDIVQPLAMHSMEKQLNFQSQIMKSSVILSHFTENEIKHLFDYQYFLQKVDEIYERVGIKIK